MGYRRLIKQYMQQVYEHTGDTWISGNTCSNLSDRDVDELRAIWSEIERDVESEALGDLNKRALMLCEQHNLTTEWLAERLGWQERVIEEWLLPAEHPRYRHMTRRDFQHFTTSINPALTRIDDCE